MAVVFQTQEEERHRIARALENGVAQLFANAALEVETCLLLMDERPEAARTGLSALVGELRRGLAEVQDLVAELQPPLLNELGLAVSLAKYCNRLSTRTGIATTCIGWESLTSRLPSTMEVAIFRIVQEAMENIRCHARATRAEVRLQVTPENLVVTISDNGQGFAAAGDALTPGRRLGLVAMSDRAELLGGQLQIFSEPARGVRVVLTVPFRGHNG